VKLIITAAALSLFVSVSTFALLRQDNEKDKRDNPPAAGTPGRKEAAR